MPMEALILVGGMGTRLSPVIGNMPKAMADVAGRPFLSYLLDQLKGQGFCDICLAVGYRSEIISDYFKDGSDFGVNLTYSKEVQPLGTGGAIKRAAGKLSKEFLVLNGDSYLDISFSDLISFHREKMALVTLALTECVKADRYGLVHLGINNKIIGFREKVPAVQGSTINAGLYVVNNLCLSDVPENVPVSFERDILPHYVNKGLYGMKVQSFFIDMGTPSSYEQVRNGLPRR